jgi:8-oxo-dGTP pyrophosphatase MutT (NUDIX family)/phosphohistidine phosphatase SixA
MTDSRAEVRAAGAVVWRRDGHGTEVALVHRPRYDDWTLPKGKCLPDEHSLITAVREVAEETGANVALGRRLTSASYVTDGRRKHVDYWAAEQAPGQRFAAGPDPAEVDGVAWLGLADAREKLSYDRDIAVLDGFAAAPAGTVPLVFLRHASAMSRRSWRNAGHSRDRARPLSALGRSQAAELAEVLTCFPPARVISSDARRCLETVAPYAGRTGARVAAEAAFGLAEGAAADGSEWAVTPAAEQRMADVVSAGGPVIICGHRQNLPLLLAMACERLHAAFPAGPPLRTGSFWVLHVAGGELLAAERHDTDGAGPLVPVAALAGGTSHPG